jgi:hypothetical protein
VSKPEEELSGMTPEELVIHGFTQKKLTQLENELLHRLESFVERYESDDLYGDDT